MLSDRKSPIASFLLRALFRMLLGARLTLTSGALEVAGPGGTVAIRRDRYGIPMIEADDELDVFFGFGFCQGQDRAMQIELSQRAAAGRLSELFGPATLRVDRLVRRAGLGHAAAEQLEVLGPRAAAIINAFAAGVNVGRTAGLPRRPHEFALLRTHPSEFTAVDVLSILKLQSFAMPSNWDCELARLMVLNLDGPDALRDLDPVYPEWHRVAAPPGAVAGNAARHLAEDLELFQQTVGMGGGSNSWAVAGSKSHTGRPLLANDPHLPASVPPHWYLARMQCPGWAVAGAALPGTPAIAAGHNGSCAWGVTAGLTDNTDLFVERLGPDGHSVLEGDEFVPCQVRREVIEVKGGPPVVEEVVITPRGPIISSTADGDMEAVSMRAVWLDPSPVSGFLGSLEAAGFEDFRQPFADWPILPLGLVYADTGGNIGYQLVGEAPRRLQGYGLVPAAGWTAGAGWESEGVPFDEMPSVLNPSCGFVVAANTQPEPHGAGPFLGADWIDGYRLGRIAGALAEGSNWNMGSTAALQLDVTSLPWQENRETVLAAPALTAESRAARELLLNWDGQMAVESKAATLFHLFLVEMFHRVAFARAPRSAPWLMGRNPIPFSGSTTFVARQMGRLSRLVKEQPEGWFPNGWPAEIADALATAHAGAVSRLGAPSRRWHWGHARKAVLKHPLGRIPFLAALFNFGPFPCPGDLNTVFQAGTVGEDPLASPGVLPSMRMALDVGNWDSSLFSLPGGQSGNPLSPHYDDLLPLWLEGKGVPIAWTAPAVEAATVETLLLKPAP